MYEYNMSDIISEEDDLPSLQIHTEQFLGCFPYTAKIHNMTPSFPKLGGGLILWGFSVNISITKHGLLISTPQFLA